MYNVHHWNMTHPLVITVLVVGVLISMGWATSSWGAPVQLSQMVEINGSPQLLDIRGNSSDLPIMLFVHGGPGSAETMLVNHYNQSLQDYFLVANWDQRGAGASYVKQVPPAETMTLDQFLADTHAVTIYLKETFQKNKIFLVGHSWGSLLGIVTAQRYPEDYYAYVGIGQVAQWDRSEALNYQGVYQMAQQEQNADAIRELQSISSPPYETYDYKDVAKIVLERKWNAYYGGAIHALRGDTLVPALITLIQESEVYQQFGVTPELYMAANNFSIALMLSQMGANPQDMVKEVAIPVYIIGGQWDGQVNTTVAKAYFDELKAPQKQFFLFEQSAHMACLEEPEKFHDIMVNIVLKENLK